MKKNIKFPKEENLKLIEKFFLKKKLNNLIKLSKKPDLKVNNFSSTEQYKPELIDLYRLYQFIVLNKRTTILEFGCGWSSILFSLALEQNKKNYITEVKNLRRNNIFELYSVDDNKKYINLTKKSLRKYTKYDALKTNLAYSKVNITKFNDRISTEYKTIPSISPDFIYLDGPVQMNIGGKLNGFHMNHPDIVPMACDILKIEYFLTPGTIILVDGRAANARFLKNNFQRKWNYNFSKKYDQHIFLLDEEPYGKFSLLQKKFYKKL